jgi:hypothetical protein
MDADLRVGWTAPIAAGPTDDDLLLAVDRGGAIVTVPGERTAEGLVPSGFWVIDARTGVARKLASDDLPAAPDAVASLTPTREGHVTVAVYRILAHAGSSSSPALNKIIDIELASGAAALVFEPYAQAGDRRDHEQALAPITLAWDPAHDRIVAAPPSFAWSAAAGAPQSAPPATGDGTGPDRPEVRGLVSP